MLAVGSDGAEICATADKIALNIRLVMHLYGLEVELWGGRLEEAGPPNL